MDENDGYDSWLWPDVATFPSGIPAEQLRNLYGSLMQQATVKMYREKNLRTYGQVRAGNAGTNAYPYVLYNDYYDHRGFITALINSSFYRRVMDTGSSFLQNIGRMASTDADCLFFAYCTVECLGGRNETMDFCRCRR